MRKDPITKRWVITSTSRSAKPSDYVSAHNPVKNSKDTCPFCAENEDTKNRTIIENNDQNGNWKTRIVENKYPILMKELTEEETSKYDEYIGEEPENYGNNSVLYQSLAATGYHDVVIESPSHDFQMYSASIDEIDAIFDIVINRLDMLSNINSMKYSLYFKNYGHEAGASIVHSHSQIVTTPFMPRQIMEKVYGASSYYNNYKSCIYCDIIAEEKKSGVRLVSENEKFIAFCPFASRSPYQISILPKEHFDSILTIDDQTRYLFSSILHDVFSKIQKVLGMPAFNYVLSTLPKSIAETYSNSFHFSFDILPKLSKLAGFEIGSSVYINSVLPEYAAEMLRSQS